MLYQLSYFRNLLCEGNETRTHTKILSLPPQSSASTNSAIPPSKQNKTDNLLDTLSYFYKRAENETRTRDPNLGKVMLYQLSYFRIVSTVCLTYRHFPIASAKVGKILNPPKHTLLFLLKILSKSFNNLIIR